MFNYGDNIVLIACLMDYRDMERVGGLADGVELRLDYWEDLSQLKKPSLPSIFTFRKKEQGGVKNIPEAERLALIERALELRPDYCDIEADTDPVFIERVSKKFPEVKLIGSYHNFEETPADLKALLAGMKNPHFAIYKIAVMARSTADMLRLMAFAKEGDCPLSVVSMGPFGRPSRILAQVMGSVFNYAGLEEDAVLHRYSLQTLHEVFRYRRLNRQTKIYALIGDPVEQSIGDLFHNARFQDNAVYVKMRVRKDELSECFELMKKLCFSGLSVTMPLKEAVLPFVESDLRAVNTIAFRNGKAIGTNTDGRGALNAIEKHQNVAGKRLAILGAGGTARAIALEAKQRGARVFLFSRTPPTFSCENHPLEALPNHSYDILINTIPVPTGATPHPKTTVMDVIYYPKETPLLAAAKKLGCFCIYGEEMFIEQALLQQQEWKIGCKKSD